MSKTEKNYVEKKENRFLIIMKRLSRNPNAMFGMILLAVLVAGVILVPAISPYEYSKMDVRAINQGPSAAHWFGTDDMGRDLLTRIFYGGRYSLSISIIAVLFSTTIGMIIGAAAGYFGGISDTIIMRCLDVIQAIPSTLLTIIISAALGVGLDKTVIAISVGSIPGTVRLLRGTVMRTREEQYLEAAEAIGCSTFRKIVKYVIPNSWSPLIVSSTMGVARTILELAALSYIGLGVQPPTPEWGAMLSAARGYLRDYPHLLIFPGIFIAISVLCLNMFGDGLRDALDPKLKD
ncbi:MAG: ABC transporter permease [Lachnospiraceae bacterium]|nr:ABC transporter permease [Lachnospiraceae bacterium]